MTDLERITETAKAVNELYANGLVLNISGSFNEPAVLMSDKEAFFRVIPQELHDQVKLELRDNGVFRVFRSIILDGVELKTLDKEEDDESV